MSKDLIINCPNTCKNNCPNCYIKAAGLDSRIDSYPTFKEQLIKYDMGTGIDNMHVFSANDAEWNNAIIDIMSKLDMIHTIKDYVYLYFNYEDDQSLRTVCRAIQDQKANASISSFHHKGFRLEFSIMDPEKHPNVYAKKINAQIFTFEDRVGEAAGILLNYTFTKDYILNRDKERWDYLITGIKYIVEHIRPNIRGPINIAISVAKPFSKDLFEINHMQNFSLSMVVGLTKVFYENNIDVNMISDYCFHNYVRHVHNLNSGGPIEVYADCTVITSVGDHLVSNKCPYSIEDIKSCEQCAFCN